jgi:hypothetical protein
LRPPRNYARSSPEAKLLETKGGLAPDGEGSFVLDVGDSRVVHARADAEHERGSSAGAQDHLVSELARRHACSVERETDELREAYAGFGRLPGAVGRTPKTQASRIPPAPPPPDHPGNDARGGTMKPYDMTNTFTSTVEAIPEDAYLALARLDPMRSLGTTLDALGVGDRAVWAADAHALGLLEADGRHQLVFGFVWRLAERSYAKATLRFSVAGEADDRSTLSVTVRVRGNGDDARDRIVDAWPALEPLFKAQARRLAVAVEELAQAPRRRRRRRLRAAA